MKSRTAGGAGAIEANKALYEQVLNPFSVKDTSGADYTDLSEEDWYYTAVRFILDNKLMSPADETTFGADAPATLGEYASSLFIMMGGGGTPEEAIATLSGVGALLPGEPGEVVEQPEDSSALLALRDEEVDFTTAVFVPPVMPLDRQWLYGETEPEEWRVLGIAPTRSPIGYVLAFPLLGVTTNAQYRVVTTAGAKVTSSIVTLGVAVQVSTKVGARSVKRGHRIRFSGKITPSKVGALYAIQRQDSNGNWKVVAGSVSRAGGSTYSTFNTKATIRKSGLYRVFVGVTDGYQVSGVGATKKISIKR